MKKFKKIIAVGMAVMGMTVLTGCSLGGKDIYFSTGLKKNDVFKIDGEACKKNEALLFLTTEKNLYEASYGSDMWSKKVDGVTLEKYVKDMVKNELAEMKTLTLLADEKKIELTDEEEEKAKNSADRFYEGLTDTEKEYMAVDADDIEDVYGDYLLAKKVFGELTADVNPEISDADAKVIKVLSIFKKTYSLDTEGNRIEYSAEEKEEIKSEMEAILAKINAGEDFATIAANKTDDQTVEYQFGRGEMIQGFEDVAFSLAAGQVSGVVETTDGYYIIKCESDYLEDETNKNKEKLVQEKKEEAFKEIYKPFVETLHSEFNDELWDGIVFEDMKDIKVNNFFEVIEKE